MTGENTIKIIADISRFINARGGECGEWQIGIAADAERELFENRQLSRDLPWIFRCATSAEEARAIMRGFMNLSCEGDLENLKASNEESVVIFLYQKPRNQKPAAENRRA